jgi:hypothetical protein
MSICTSYRLSCQLNRPRPFPTPCCRSRSWRSPCCNSRSREVDLGTRFGSKSRTLLQSHRHCRSYNRLCCRHSTSPCPSPSGICSRTLGCPWYTRSYRLRSYRTPRRLYLPRDLRAWGICSGISCSFHFTSLSLSGTYYASGRCNRS